MLHTIPLMPLEILIRLSPVLLPPPSHGHPASVPWVMLESSGELPLTQLGWPGTHAPLSVSLRGRGCPSLMDQPHAVFPWWGAALGRLLSEAASAVTRLSLFCVLFASCSVLESPLGKTGLPHILSYVPLRPGWHPAVSPPLQRGGPGQVWWPHCFRSPCWALSACCWRLP